MASPRTTRPTRKSETQSSDHVCARSSPSLVSSHEEMNPSKRSSMEDCSVYAAPGTWGAPDEDMAYLGVYDGHGGTIKDDFYILHCDVHKGFAFLVDSHFHHQSLLKGREMVDYLEHGLSYHVAQELQFQDDASIPERLERAFLMADIHSKQLGITTSGATVAICLIQVRR